VSYADDFSIYTKYKSHAHATLKGIENWCKTNLKLSINLEKSVVRKPVQFELLGFRFESTYKKGDKGKYQLVIAEKAWKRLKQRLKTITRQTTPMSFDERTQKINEVQRGWMNFFGKQVLKLSSNCLTVGYETDCAIVFGIIGRNPRERERISLD